MTWKVDAMSATEPTTVAPNARPSAEASAGAPNASALAQPHGVEQPDAGACCRSRRQMLGQTLLGGTVVAGAALALAACSAPAAPQEAPSAPASSSGTGHDVLALSELAVGAEAAVSINKANVLLYRPDEKTVLAYSAVCTHAGCQVGTSKDTQFFCDCHSSTFSAKDGSVVSGPAPRPLERYAATIEKDRVMVYL